MFIHKKKGFTLIKKEFQEYFEKLNLQPESLSLELVSEIQKQHIANFSFNNFAVLLGKSISLEISDILNKIVTTGLGGYCFEHNKLMHDVLKSLGFNVRCLIARVINNQNIDSPRTHRITLLEWQNNHYLIDVGFGPKCPQDPIKIVDFKGAEETHSNYRIVRNQYNDYQLEINTDEGYYSLYTFNLNRYTEADCMVGNFYSNKHPKAVFVSNLVVSLIFPDMRLSLMNSTYHRIGLNNTEIVDIADHIHLQSIIDEDFNIMLSEVDCRTIYKKVCNSALF